MNKRICLWSCPRNVSTALMYSFAQRRDTKVFDEPLYAHYLSESKANHPGREEDSRREIEPGPSGLFRSGRGEHDRTGQPRCEHRRLRISALRVSATSDLADRSRYDLVRDLSPRTVGRT